MLASSLVTFLFRHSHPQCLSSYYDTTHNDIAMRVNEGSYD